MTKNIHTIASEYIYKVPPIDDNRKNYKFELVKDSQGRGWLYTLDVKSPASHIYVTDSKDWNGAGEGFGGSTIKFTLVSGEEFSLHGGWHTNSDSFFSATGIDLRNQHLTLVHLWSEKIKLLHDEQDWVLGKFSREDDLLVELGLETKKVFVACRSSGGGSFGWRNYG